MPVPDPGETVVFGWLEEAVQPRPAPENVTVIVCALVTRDPAVPKLSEERLSDMVDVAPTPLCETVTFCGPMIKFPVRLCELEFALTDQDAVPPDTNTDAQFTFEAAASDGQETGFAVIARFPDEPLEPTLTLAGFIV